MTRYVIDARQIRWNAAILRRELHGVPVIGVVKCDAYGAGLLPVSRILLDEGAAALAVLHFHEAETLRRSGVGAPILMLTPAVTAAEADTVLRLDLTASVDGAQSCALLESAAERAGKTVPVHLMLDTGFGRFGWLPDETGALLRDLKRCPRLRVEGLYSHLHDAYTARAKDVDRQRMLFTGTADALERAGLPVGVRHLAATAAALRFPETRMDAVRVGSAFYGLLPFADKWGFCPVGHLECEVSAVKRLPAGHNVGYGGLCRTKRETTIAVVNAGHVDGWGMTPVRDCFRLRDRLRYLKADLRSLRRDGRTFVEIGGQRFPLLGRFTMSNVIVDVTGGDVRPGDTVRIELAPTCANGSIPRVLTGEPAAASAFAPRQPRAARCARDARTAPEA